MKNEPQTTPVKGSYCKKCSQLIRLIERNTVKHFSHVCEKEISNPQTTGFPSGTVVRHHGKPPNLLVMRCLGETTWVVSSEVDEIGTPKFWECPTAELQKVFAND